VLRACSPFRESLAEAIDAQYFSAELREKIHGTSMAPSQLPHRQETPTRIKEECLTNPSGF